MINHSNPLNLTNENAPIKKPFSQNGRVIPTNRGGVARILKMFRTSPAIWAIFGKTSTILRH
ncbi:hypothetical protein COD96_25955 [Bacillus thuringiensis]|nr:hypothetical protein DX930_24230 [Bacillus cereus]KAA6472405.1 hypothetical protein DX931_24685 [Bacillus cereus]KXY57714.1 hypothetical protein AT261_14745 [Bacillus cereus]PEC12997.1 hypothetical protein CON19_31175 [Bacillus thuringiensis]PGV63826.1 hypothetical protein COD96_25955 [Bacillus thuringiensis]